jgi:hypothetical protein
MTMKFRSVTAGTCALNGQHRDPRMAAECPVLRAQKRGAKSPQSAQNDAGHTEIAGSPETASENDETARGYGDDFAPLATAHVRRGRPGRPATGESRWARRRRRLATAPA